MHDFILTIWNTRHISLHFAWFHLRIEFQLLLCYTACYGVILILLIIVVVSKDIFNDCNNFLCVSYLNSKVYYHALRYNVLTLEMTE